MSVADELAWLRFMAQIWKEQVVIDRMQQAFTQPPSRMKAPRHKQGA